jgi:uncharacterized protein (TIGR02466 family)
MSAATLQAFAYFPAMVYRDDHPEWVEYTKAVVAKHYAAAPQDGALLQTGYMANDPDLKFLVDYLLQSSTEILRSQGYDVDRYDFYLSGLWGQDVDCNGGTNVHVHKNSQISGWMFLDVPENGSYPVYYDPRKNKEMIELDFLQGNELVNASSSVHFKNIAPGTVLFANSWMQHQLTQNSAIEKTKSIHFTVSHKDKGCSTCNM